MTWRRLICSQGEGLASIAEAETAYVDKRPAKGQRGVDMMTGKPVPGVKLKANKHAETFDPA